MFVQRFSLERREVKSHRRGGVLIFSEKVMTREMVFRQCYELGRRYCACARKHLGVDMAAQLLHTDFVKTSFGRNWTDRLALGM